MSAELEALEAALEYAFQNRDLLRRALTHKSCSQEKRAEVSPSTGDNERLEFLGDSILGFLVSELLLERHPALAEGRLSKLKAHLVSAAHLHVVAERVNLGRNLLLGRGEEKSGGRAKRTLLANALEALIAAVYLDGGMPAAREMVQRLIVGAEEQPEVADVALADYKGALQEAAQARGLSQPRYALVKECGPDHAKTFTVEVRVGQQWSSLAEGCSKKSAGQAAARFLLEELTRSAPRPI